MTTHLFSPITLGKLEFPATVVRIAPRLDEDSRQARVELAVSNPQRWLKPGMFVQAQVVLASVLAPVVVPQAALAQRDGQIGVFQVAAGVDSADDDVGRAVAHFTPVTIGITEGEWVQILEPELEGWVVTLGQHLLREGEVVRVAQPPLVENDEQQ